MFSRITAILETLLIIVLKCFWITLFLVLLYLGPLPLQIRTKLRKSLKGILNCCKLQIVFKSQNKLAKAFRLKDRIPKKLTSGVVYKFQYGFWNESYYGECVRHRNVKHWRTYRNLAID